MTLDRQLGRCLNAVMRCGQRCNGLEPVAGKGADLADRVKAEVGQFALLQTSFILQNELHATSRPVSTLRLLTGLPVYFAFVFGLARDHCNPLGLRDRGFLLIFAPATAAAFIRMAVSEFTYTGLVVGTLLAMLSSRFILAAYG